MLLYVCIMYSDTGNSETIGGKRGKPFPHFYFASQFFFSSLSHYQLTVHYLVSSKRYMQHIGTWYILSILERETFQKTFTLTYVIDNMPNYYERSASGSEHEHGFVNFSWYFECLNKDYYNFLVCTMYYFIQLRFEACSLNIFRIIFYQFWSFCKMASNVQ